MITTNTVFWEKTAVVASIIIFKACYKADIKGSVMQFMDNIFTKELRLLGCYAVWLVQGPTFRRNLAPPSSG
jgi:hypothetical protein